MLFTPPNSVITTGSALLSFVRMAIALTIPSKILLILEEDPSFHPVIRIQIVSQVAAFKMSALLRFCVKINAVMRPVKIF